MPYADNGRISQSPIDGGIEITAEQYQQALDGMLRGEVVSIDGGFSVAPKPEPEKTEPEPHTPEQIAEQVRAERDARIEAIRWRIERAKDEAALGVPLTEPLEPLLQYVQLLRDVPQQAGFPESVEWPPEP